MASDQAEAVLSNALYDQDFYAWTQEQARLMRERRFDDLDLENLIDEVQSVGSSEKREIGNWLTVLLAHLLKWKFQPGHRGTSWHRTIHEQRRQLADILTTSPSLRNYAMANIERRYLGGTLDASMEMGIAIGVFPKSCPFTPEQVFDPEFFPEDPSFE